MSSSSLPSVVLAVAEVVGLTLVVRVAEGWMVGDSNAGAAAARPIGGCGTTLQMCCSALVSSSLERLMVVGQVDDGSEINACWKFNFVIKKQPQITLELEL
jgi:hypothetical protein